MTQAEIVVRDESASAAASGAGVAGRSRDLLAFAPLAVAVAAAALTALLGLTQRELLASPFGDYFYGYFFDLFAPFVFLVVYALARVLVVAATARGVSLFLRLATAPLGLALILAASFYPTFGGFVLRAAFFSGGTTFLQGTGLTGAYLIGAAFSMLVFASALGLGVLLARLRVEFSRRAALFALLRWLALVFAASVLAAPRALGLDFPEVWPVWPLGAGEGAALTALVLVALLPHALIVRLRG